jgi:hypothetical protein
MMPNPVVPSGVVTSTNSSYAVIAVALSGSPKARKIRARGGPTVSSSGGVVVDVDGEAGDAAPSVALDAARGDVACAPADEVTVRL